jgi:hypothetical protein
MKPAVPGTPGDPVWQGTVHMSDGRTFITDGGLANLCSAPNLFGSGQAFAGFPTARSSDRNGLSRIPSFAVVFCVCRDPTARFVTTINPGAYEAVERRPSWCRS